MNRFLEIFKCTSHNESINESKNVICLGDICLITSIISGFILCFMFLINICFIGYRSRLGTFRFRLEVWRDHQYNTGKRKFHGVRCHWLQLGDSQVMFCLNFVSSCLGLKMAKNQFVHRFFEYEVMACGRDCSYSVNKITLMVFSDANKIACSCEYLQFIIYLTISPVEFYLPQWPQ